MKGDSYRRGKTPPGFASRWLMDGRNRLHLGEVIRHCPASTKSLLDVGCGLGDLVPVARARWSSIAYEGIDSSEELISEARRTYPQGRFRVGDAAFLSGSWDVVVLSGTLYGTQSDYWERADALLQAAQGVARWGVIATFRAARGMARFSTPAFAPDEAQDLVREHFSSVKLIPSQRAPLWILVGRNTKTAPSTSRRPA